MMQTSPAALARTSAGAVTHAAAAGVARLCTVFVNLYFVESAEGGWVLVDTGLPRLASLVKRAAEARFGPGARPRAIILTHGHFDHAGNALALADEWDAPVYAHPLEMPFLTGQSDYPPQDPTPGGAICFLSRFFPNAGFDLGDRVKPLPDDSSVPHLPEWRWLHTPGHTNGHVSLFRDADATLIAGDAVATMDMDAWSAQFTWPRELGRPATPFTPDWPSARRSIGLLADLEPRTVAAGHGLPITARGLGIALRHLADTLAPPIEGRYTGHPARFGPSGAVAAVPPPARDPLPSRLAIAGALTTLGLAAAIALRPSRR